jgi:hypothetical protein
VADGHEYYAASNEDMNTRASKVGVGCSCWLECRRNVTEFPDRQVRL